MTTQIACRDVLELITGYLDGALPADVHAAVEAHLAGLRRLHDGARGVPSARSR